MGGGGADEAGEDLAAWGASGDLRQRVAERNKERVRIWPENWETVRLFLSLDTQWRYHQGVPLGLDYPAVEAVLRLSGVEDARQVFEGLQTMERAALAVFRNSAPQSGPG